MLMLVASLRKNNVQFNGRFYELSFSASETTYLSFARVE